MHDAAEAPHARAAGFQAAHRSEPSTGRSSVLSMRVPMPSWPWRVWKGQAACGRHRLAACHPCDAGSAGKLHRCKQHSRWAATVALHLAVLPARPQRADLGDGQRVVGAALQGCVGAGACARARRARVGAVWRRAALRWPRAAAQACLSRAAGSPQSTRCAGWACAAGTRARGAEAARRGCRCLGVMRSSTRLVSAAAGSRQGCGAACRCGQPRTGCNRPNGAPPTHLAGGQRPDPQLAARVEAGRKQHAAPRDDRGVTVAGGHHSRGDLLLLAGVLSLTGWEAAGLYRTSAKGAGAPACNAAAATGSGLRSRTQQGW